MTTTCMATDCPLEATWQWQRHLTEEETTTYLNTPGPYGPIIHGPGPYTTTIYACTQHTPKTDTGEHDLNTMTKIHNENCPTPNPGCTC